MPLRAVPRAVNLALLATSLLAGCASHAVDVLRDGGADIRPGDVPIDRPSSDTGVDVTSDRADAIVTLTDDGPGDAIDGGAADVADAMIDVDAARICRVAGDCRSGEDCAFRLAGCGITGVCTPRSGCGAATLLYCGCDNQTTFADTCGVALAPWVHVGPCSDSSVVISSDGSAGSDSGGGPCSAGCAPGLTCCGTTCMNLANDPINCGGCGLRCTGSTPMCDANRCVPSVCAPACGSSQSCCIVNRGGPIAAPSCHDGPTCPVGCPSCD